MKNPELLRNACLINGKWIATTGASIQVHKPVLTRRLLQVLWDLR